MVGHDPQRSDRSPATVPATLHLVFQTQGVLSSPVVDGRARIYGWSGSVVALTRSGHQRWRYRLSKYLDAPPALTPNGTLIIGAFPPKAGVSPETTRLYGIGTGGRKRWAIRPGRFSKGVAPLASPTGTILAPYVGPTSGYLAVVAPSGRLTHRFTEGSCDAVAQSATGTIYGVFASGGGLVLIALDPTDQMLWQHDVGSPGKPVRIMVGQAGTVYVATGTRLHAFDPAGGSLWTYQTGSDIVQLAEREDGAVLVADQDGLVTLTTDGRVRWQVALPPVPYLSSPGLAVDAAGTAYIALLDGSLRAVSRGGDELFRRMIEPAAAYGRPEVVIDPDGRLIISGADGKLRVFGS